MSTEKGNTSRTRAQKHKNETKFINNKYDCSKKTKLLNNMQLTSLCPKCEDVIQWKIRYKKYKPLTVPSKCIKCGGKCVKSAYHNICTDCSEQLEVCAKCGEHMKIASGENISED